MNRAFYLTLWALGCAIFGCGLVWALTHTIIKAPIAWLLYAAVGLLGLGAGACIGAMGFVGIDVAADEARRQAMSAELKAE